MNDNFFNVARKKNRTRHRSKGPERGVVKETKRLEEEGSYKEVRVGKSRVSRILMAGKIKGR